jgi:1-deoxy-D-xylulose-5-phosphate reductoisomerase
MKKNISILGSTGSIGVSALDILSTELKDYRVIALTANSNIAALAKQIKKFSPKYACAGTARDAAKLQKKFKKTKILSGVDGLAKIASLKETDTVLLGIVGAAGITPLLSAIRASKRVALANKESLIIAGDLINAAVKKHKAELIPVDSEHSAIFQALQGNKKEHVKKIIITASGGALKNIPEREMKNITVERALAHPTWKMGKKITIDSATLMNKGLEVIEAHYLFGLPYEKIEIVIHAQSIIHSMVEYVDGSVIAQMSKPDMRLPIMYALTYPERRNSVIEPLNLADLKKLDFDHVDFKRFKACALAIKAGKRGGTMPACMNAANETAVEAFLRRRIKFNEIVPFVEKAMNGHRNIMNPSLDQILAADHAAREYVEALING